MCHINFSVKTDGKIDDGSDLKQNKNVEYFQIILKEWSKIQTNDKGQAIGCNLFH